MIELRFKDVLSDLHASFVFSALSNIHQVLDLFQLVLDARGGGVEAELLDECILVLKECLCVGCSVGE